MESKKKSKSKKSEKNTESIENVMYNLWEEFSMENEEVIIPKAFFCRHQGKTYITMDDSKSIFYFYSFRGKIFVAAKRFCKIVKINNITYYDIENYDELQVISCRNQIDDVREPFITKKLKSFLALEI